MSQHLLGGDPCVPCSTSSANLSHVRAMSMRMDRTRIVCARSAVCRDSAASSRHSVASIIPASGRTAIFAWTTSRRSRNARRSSRGWTRAGKKALEPSRPLPRAPHIPKLPSPPAWRTLRFRSSCPAQSTSVRGGPGQWQPLRRRCQRSTVSACPTGSRARTRGATSSRLPIQRDPSTWDLRI